MTWMLLPRYRDLLLQIDTGVGGQSRAPGSVSVTLPGVFSGADHYTVASCQSSANTSAPATSLALASPICPEKTSIPLLALAMPASGGVPLAFTETRGAPSLSSAISLPAWRTDFVDFPVTVTGLTARAPSAFRYDAALVAMGRTPALIASVSQGASSGSFTVHSPSLDSIDATLQLELVGGDATTPFQRFFRFIDTFTGASGAASYDLTTLLPAPKALTLNQSEPARPSLQVEGDPAIGRADFLCAQLESTASANGASYRWTGCAPSAASRTFRVPVLNGEVANIIATSPITSQSAIVADSDLLTNFDDALVGDLFAAVTRDGELTFQNSLTVAITSKSSP